MSCDIVVVVWNEPELTARALKSIHDNANHPYRLIVVDNASESATVTMLEEAQRSGRFGEMELIRNSQNLGWVLGANQGLARAQAKYVCLMNNDLYTGPDWLKIMVEALERHPTAGLANPRGDERSENRKVSDPDAYARELRARCAGSFTELDYCTGFCMLVKREVIDKIGVLDEAYGFGYFEDVDFSRRAQRAGYLCIQCDDAYVQHRQSVSFKKVSDERKRLTERNRKIYEERWGKKRNLLVWPCVPAADDLLALARRGHVLYVVQNEHFHPAQLAQPHANIKFLRAPFGRFGQALCFLYKAFYLRRKSRIDNAFVLFSKLEI